MTVIFAGLIEMSLTASCIYYGTPFIDQMPPLFSWDHVMGRSDMSQSLARFSKPIRILLVPHN